MTFTCGRHRAYVYERGGQRRIAELPMLSRVKWGRVRDDISVADVVVPTSACCELLSFLRTIKHELHVYRDDLPVWQGPITRIEIEASEARLFAEDVLWASKRSVIEVGYSHAYPNIGNVIGRMEWLLYHAYTKLGDPWGMAGHIHPVHGPNDPKTSRIVFAWQMYVWEDFDKYAEDYGADYVVVHRDVYMFDHQLKWITIPDLDENDLSQSVRIVEYGNQLAVRGIVTNGRGFAGISPVNVAGMADYGLVDLLITNEIDGTAGADPGAPAPTPPSEAGGDDDEDEGEPPEPGPPSPQEIAQWTDTATRNIADKSPSPVSVVIPENTTLMPHAPWEINDLVPGAWFRISTTRLCRAITEWQRLDKVTVTEEAPNGETVAITCSTAPINPVIYTGPPP